MNQKKKKKKLLMPEPLLAGMEKGKSLYHMAVNYIYYCTLELVEIVALYCPSPLFLECA